MYDVILGAWSAVTDELETTAIVAKDGAGAVATEYGQKNIEEGDELVRRTDAINHARMERLHGRIGGLDEAIELIQQHSSIDGKTERLVLESIYNLRNGLAAETESQDKTGESRLSQEYHVLSGKEIVDELNQKTSLENREGDAAE